MNLKRQCWWFTILHISIGDALLYVGIFFLYMLARSMESKCLFLCLGCWTTGWTWCRSIHASWGWGEKCVRWWVWVFPLNSLYMFINQSLGKISNLTICVSFNWNVGWLSCFVTWDNRIWEVKHFTATTVTLVDHHLTPRSSIGESSQPTWKIVEFYSTWMCLQWLFTSFPLKPTFGEGYFVFFSFNCSEPPENVSVDLGRMYICWHL